MCHTLILAQRFLVAAIRPLVVIALLLFAIPAAYVLVVVIHRLIRADRSPMRSVPGPKNAHWSKGSFVDVPEEDSLRLQEEWVKTYGHVLRYHSVFGVPKLMAVDPVAISYILQNDDTFEKAEFIRYILGTLTGRGTYKQFHMKLLRNSMILFDNPAFGPTQLKNFASMFLEKSLELRDIWADLVSKSSRKDGKLRLDACSWLDKATLDIVGLAGFNYAFDSLHSDQNPVYVAFRSLENIAPINFIYAVQVLFPIFRSIPTSRSRAIERALKEVRQVGSRVIEERKAAVLAERSASGSSLVEKQDVQGNDLLSLLVKSNIAADIPESMRLSDFEILSQVPTILLAGNETTSTAVSWALFALSCHPGIQTKLRTELRTCPTDSPTLEQLNSLSYLEGVVRESLRLYTPVPFIQRVATHDVAIPLQKPFTDKHGVLQNSVRVAKGDLAVIPIRLLHHLTDIWGEDVNEFRPERWENLPEAVHGFPSVYGHLSTFSAGPHACIGYRFTIAEVKALLFTLVRAFEFELALPADDIVCKSGAVSHPVVASNPAVGRQLPLLIRPANMD
ncbi:cytochrome P450 [Lactifluus volemus]|nr:cytochrome P450 [Lactifluus volemus]